MKRLILAISSLLYLSTAIGANLHLHYCMGELESWGFESKTGKKCGNCGMEKKAAAESGCCKDEFRHIKLNADQKSPNSFNYQFQLTNFESLPPYIVASVILYDEQKDFSNPGHRPPRSCCLARYIRHCNFRI